MVSPSSTGGGEARYSTGQVWVKKPQLGENKEPLIGAGSQERLLTTCEASTETQTMKRRERGVNEYSMYRKIMSRGKRNCIHLKEQK